VDIPGGFAELGVPETPAVVWFRKQIVLPNPLPAGRALLFLGSVEGMDTAYINGTEVGASARVENHRVYFIHEGVLKPGKNLVAIRVFKTEPKGGFSANGKSCTCCWGTRRVFPSLASGKPR
jgi:sialate O-acetylesterase